MIKDFLKTLLAGVLLGSALFMLPFFIIKILIFFLLCKMAFRLLGFGRHRRRFAYQFQNMSAEEKEAFKNKFGERCCGNYYAEKPNAGTSESSL